MSSETEQLEAENDQLALDEAELAWREEQLKAGVRTGFVNPTIGYDKTSEGHWITLRIAFLKKRIERIRKAQREAAQFKSWEERVSAGQNSRR